MSVEQKEASIQSEKRWPVILIAVVLLAVAIGVWFWLAANKSEKLTQQFFNEDTKMSLMYPEGWELEDLSSGNLNSYHWQLSGPKNDETQKYLAENYNSQSDSLAASRDKKFNDIVLVDITIRGEPKYAVYKDLAEWRQSAESESDTGGYELTKFSELKIDQFDAYRYLLTFDLGEAFGTGATYNYVAVMPKDMLEVYIFPSTTNYLGIADKIIQSIEFTR